MDLGLKGKVALITGGGRDVGRAIALDLAREGAAVAVNYNASGKSAEAVVAEIAAAGGRAIACKADITDNGAVRAMVDGVVKELGRLDILVNNAGLVLRQRFVDTTPEDWRRQIDVCLYGTIHCCHAAIPHMIRQNGGRIVSLAGDSSRIGESGLALGLVETSHTDKAWLDANREKITRLYPLRRLGQAEDVSPLVALLVSDAGAWITGQVMSVNGGFSMAG